MRPHPDLDQLALHALGEPALDEAEREHLLSCSGCATTVGELAETVRTARGPAFDDPGPVGAVPVPAHVWQGISTELGLDPAVRPASVGPSSLRSRGRGEARPSVEGTAARGPATPGPADVDPLPSVQPGTPAPAPDRPVRTVGGPVPLGGTGASARSRSRTRPLLGLLAVAAAGLAVGAAGAALLVPRLAGDPVPAEPVILAAADLEAFGAGEGTEVSGSARLAAPQGAEAGDDRVLQVWLDQLPDTGDGFFEAWLIDPDTGAIVSLGPVPTGGPGEVTVELPVPRGLDVDAYDLVDVSAEPHDGDPTHSGVSLVRGTLGT